MIDQGFTERLLILDDDDLARASYRRVLRCTHEVIEASTVAQAKELITAHDVARAILDYRLPDGDGLELLAWMRARGVDCLVLVATGELDPSVAARAFLLGAQFVFKPVPPEVLSAFARAPKPLDVSLEAIVRAYANKHALSARQTELLSRLLDGTPRGELATRLGIGQNTIKTMVREILAKTHQPSTNAIVSELLERAAEARARSRRS